MKTLKRPRPADATQAKSYVDRVKALIEQQKELGADINQVCNEAKEAAALEPAGAMSFSVILPLPPSTNRLFANVPGKGRVKTRAYKLWRKNAVLSIFAQARADRRLSGAVSIDIVLPEMCRLDIDNAIKPILDALVASQRIDDDRYVAELHVRRVRSDETVLVSVERVVTP